MKLPPALLASVTCLSVGLALAGCSKSEAPAQQQAPTAPEAQTGAAAPTAAPAVAESAPVDQQISQVTSAMKAGDYQTATTALLAARKQKQLSPAQSQAIFNADRALEVQLARSAGSDPKAKAALDSMRAAAANDRP